jgi:hypothetical protein
MPISMFLSFYSLYQQILKLFHHQNGNPFNVIISWIEVNPMEITDVWLLVLIKGLDGCVSDEDRQTALPCLFFPESVQ